MPSGSFVIELTKFLVKEGQDWIGLDVGCGGHIGQLAEYGLDAAEVATFVLPNYPRDKFTQGDVYEMPFEDNRFDFVISSHLIEHLQRPILALEEMVRVAKYMVIANIPRYTRDIKIALKYPCISLDQYYFSAFPEKMVEFGLTRDNFPVWSPGSTMFDSFNAPHCGWYPFPEDGIRLFENTGRFKKVTANECYGNCGESNIWAWL